FRGGERKKGRLSMLLNLLTLAAIAVALYYWLALPRPRFLPRWNGIGARASSVLARPGAPPRGLRANSTTIARAYAAQPLGVLDEAKVLDWSQLLGGESAGRVMVIMGVVMILLRLVTRTAVSFRAQQ